MELYTQAIDVQTLHFPLPGRIPQQTLVSLWTQRW